MVTNHYRVLRFRIGQFTNRNAAEVTETVSTDRYGELFAVAFDTDRYATHVAGAISADGYGSESACIGLAADGYGSMNHALGTGADRYRFLAFRTASAPDCYTAEACDRSSITDSDSVIGRTVG